MACPRLERLVKRFITDAGFDPGPQDDAGESELSWLWSQLTYQPKVWAFGHFHTSQQRQIKSSGRIFICITGLIEDNEPIGMWDSDQQYKRPVWTMPPF